MWQLPRARLDDGDARALDDRLDEPLAAARDERVEVAVEGHQVARGGAGGVGDELDAVAREPRALERAAHDLGERGVRPDGLLAAPQDAGVGRFEAEAGRVDGDVGARLVDHADHAERHPHLFDLEPVGAAAAADDLPDRVGQLHEVAHRLRDVRNARPESAQAVLRRRDHAVFLCPPRGPFHSRPAPPPRSPRAPRRSR